MQLVVVVVAVVVRCFVDHWRQFWVEKCRTDSQQYSYRLCGHWRSVRFLNEIGRCRESRVGLWDSAKVRE